MPPSRIITGMTVAVLLLSSSIPAYAATTAAQHLQQRQAKSKRSSSTSSISSSVSSKSSSKAAKQIIDFGITLKKTNDGRFVVSSIMPNAMLEPIELKVGYEVYAVDDKDVKSFMSPEQVAAMLNGPDGSQSTVQVAKPGGGLSNITLVRKYKTNVAPITVSMIDNTAVITVAIFDKTAVANVRSLCQETVKKGGYKAVLINLLQDPGGSIQGVEKFLSCFLPRRTTIATIGSTPVVTSATPIFDAKVPMGVLAAFPYSDTTRIAYNALHIVREAKSITRYHDFHAQTKPVTQLNVTGKETVITDKVKPLEDNPLSTFSPNSGTYIDSKVSDADVLQAAVDYLAGKKK